MEQLATTYKVISDNKYVWLFKYNLNGDLIHYEVMEGSLTENQCDWLFRKGNFPWKESSVKKWDSYKNIRIEVGEPDYSFNSLWELYGHKIKRFDSENKFNKLKQADIIKCFVAVPEYKKYLQSTGVSQTNLATFIHQRYYEDDWKKAIKSK